MTSRRILRYVSDLHLELRETIDHSKLIPLWKFKSNDLDKNYLALLGDIGNPYQENLLKFLKKITGKFTEIFYVPGNHEYYNLDPAIRRTKQDYDTELEKICGGFSNVILMRNRSWDLNNIKIIGSTLWSHIDDDRIQNSIRDYRLILNSESDPITIADTNRWNTEATEFIRGEISKNETLPCIILTHHAPLYSNVELNQFTADIKYLHGENNQAFHNDLAWLLKKPVVAWLYGHTHYTSKFKINNVIVATNQLGYLHEEADGKFNSWAYLDLDDIALTNL
jgi:predicted phosphodiesterase